MDMGDFQEMSEKKPRDGVKEIEKVCISVMKLQDADFMAVSEVIEGQAEYNHPLKNGTANRQHQLSAHNQRVTEKLIELREIIKLGATI